VNDLDEIDSLLLALDSEQREAAMSLNGPTCIIAGAGTGKTRTITHRIAYGISRGFFSANRVMALTYTNKAAAELRARLRALGVGEVAARTFHAAALSQLEFFWPQYAGVRAPSVLDGKARLLGKLADEARLKLDTAALRDVAAEIEWRKYSMRTLDEYAALERKPPAGLSKQKFLDLMVSYEDAKVAAGQIDWEDVLVLCLGLLRAEPVALAHVHQQYRFFTVDEYQDISPLQQALLETWLGDRNDICVVGDPNQTIYSFTGASSSYLHGFASKYPNATEVELTRNYRSTQQIVAFANRLRSSRSAMGDSGVSDLESQGAVGLAPRLMAFDNATDEAAYVAHQIKTLLTNGVKPKQIAILYRVNGQSETLEAALTNAGIGYQLKGGLRFFARPEIQAAMRAIKAEIIAKVGKPTHKAVQEICRELGWYVRSNAEAGDSVTEKRESLDSLVRILDELPEDITLEAFFQELQERAATQHEPDAPAITLATMHAAKGLEWDHVFIVGVSEGLVPISHAKTASALAEENRLLYVGVTRAKQSLMITWSGAESRFVSLLRPRQA